MAGVKEAYRLFHQSRGSLATEQLHVSNNEEQNNYESPTEMYKAKVQCGELKPDPQQEYIIQHLQTLHDKLKGYKPVPPKGDNIFSKLLSFTSSSQKPVSSIEDKPRKYSNSPKGLYLYGSVGCDKTMLMDFFHHTSGIQCKKRI